MKIRLFPLILCVLIQAHLLLPLAAKTIDSNDRFAWLEHAKFGLFIHWGLYSQVGKGEWHMNNQKVPIEEYSLLAKSFNPTNFNAAEWVGIAKDAGMKYIVITSKHHDGFALFGSNASAYNIVDATPFKRDVIAELKEACDAAGIKLGLYYSHAQDWYHRGGMSTYNWKEPSSMEEMNDYLRNISMPQVREILTRYKPAILWFDTPGRMTPELARPFTGLVREISPDTLINSRLIFSGREVNELSQEKLRALEMLDVDYLSYMDRQIPENSPWTRWETCMTLNHSWGFTERDNDWKSPSLVISQLLEIVSKNGTFLLNVGPTEEGEIPAESVAVLKKVGEWLQLNGAPVYGAKPVSFNIPGTPTQASLKHKAEVEARFAKLNKPAPLTPLERTYPWIATRNGNSIYLTIFKWPAENQLTIERVKQQIQGICLSSTTDQPVEFTHKGDRLAITLPAKPTGDLPPVLCLSLAVDQPQ
jgi:alpha-L-fucosidase